MFCRHSRDDYRIRQVFVYIDLRRRLLRIDLGTVAGRAGRATDRH